MTKINTKGSQTKMIQFLAGGVILILGVTLILVWWADVVSLFKGALGIGLALGGLVMLYMVNK